MNDSYSTGVVLAVLGTAIGVVGGLVGTYASLRRARSAPEYRFLLKLAAAIWLALVALVAGQLSLGWPYSVALIILYAVGLPWSIRYANARLAEFGSEQ